MKTRSFYPKLPTKTTDQENEIRLFEFADLGNRHEAPKKQAERVDN